jgi:hypothetical protein|tara:strand:+ start:151 stop:636 length:486 start_codon:yes stop_codon:yes gene_type:complete
MKSVLLLFIITICNLSLAQFNKQTFGIQGGTSIVQESFHRVLYSVGQKSIIGHSLIEDKHIFSGFIHPLLNIQILPNIEIYPEVYPNPFKTNFIIEFPDNSVENLFLKLFDLRGLLVFEQEYQLKQKILDIITPSNLSTGSYLLHLEFNGIHFQKQLILKR